MRKALFFVMWSVWEALCGAMAQDVVLNQGREAAQARHEDVSTEPRAMRLWEGAAPGALGEAEQDRPTLTMHESFHAAEPTAAVLVIPGGSYAWLATNHEGRQVANWLNAMGIAAFVLRYRVGPKYHHPVKLGDVQQAIRMVRAKAREFGVLPDKIGFWDFLRGDIWRRRRSRISIRGIRRLWIRSIA